MTQASLQALSTSDNTIVADGDSQREKLIQNLNYAADITGATTKHQLILGLGRHTKCPACSECAFAQCERKQIFLGDQQFTFLLAFKRLVHQFEQYFLKPPAAFKGPENLYGKNRHTNCATFLYYQSSERGKKKKQTHRFVHLF